MTKQVSDFLEGADPKKAKVKKQKTEEKPVLMTREEEFTDDKYYFSLMDEYKQVRRHDRKRAQKILEKANDVARGGKVSPQAKLGAAYL